jgi:hypothetical protein
LNFFDNSSLSTNAGLFQKEVTVATALPLLHAIILPQEEKPMAVMGEMEGMFWWWLTLL